MTRVHEPEAANKVESVRLFYIGVNLTMPAGVMRFGSTTFILELPGLGFSII